MSERAKDMRGMSHFSLRSVQHLWLSPFCMPGSRGVCVGRLWGAAWGLVMENIQALRCLHANPVPGTGYSQRRTRRCPLHAICGIRTLIQFISLIFRYVSWDILTPLNQGSFGPGSSITSEKQLCCKANSALLCCPLYPQGHSWPGSARLSTSWALSQQHVT